jgi:ankyrin repeat protein
MDMCHFAGLDDIEYKKVAAALSRMIKMVTGQPRKAENFPLSEDQRRTLVDSLRFDQIHARQMSIKSAHAKTCRWLLKDPEYLSWLDMDKVNEHYGFLWIKGKPGAGKSTLMKFALANSQKLMKDRTVISFFFNARGADLEKSTTGMYRSLLLQLLERLPELQCVFESLGFRTWNSTGHQTWSIESLKDLFEQAIRLLGQSSVVCFIDALDECDEDQIRDMVAFFQRLGELAISTHTLFQVLLSSRHYPHITITKGRSLILEGQEGHNQDITSYVDNQLIIGHGSLVDQIRAELQEKASGVFMWVVLVVDILNKEHDEGRTTRRLQQKLKDIPSNLHKLFRDILTRDCRNRDELLLCIQWLLFARQPLKPEQLYYAIRSGTEPKDLSNGGADEISIETIKRFILNSSKGLAEITKSKMRTVQFIHESVRDFLLKENGLRDVWSELGSNFQGESHDRLKHCCLRYMDIDSIVHLNVADPLPKASCQDAIDLRDATGKEFPFLEYAVNNVLYHAEAAQVGGIHQKEFIQSFQLTNWLKFHNLFEKHEIRRHTKASLLYILAECNMSALIRIHPLNRSCFDVEDERYGPPIFAALATGSDEAVQALLDVQAEIQPLQSPLHDLCRQYAEGDNKRTKFGRGFAFSRHRSVLSYLVDNSDEVLLTFLLSSGNIDADLKDQQGQTLLRQAVENGHEGIVKLLLDKGADLESKDGIGWTPLLYAAQRGHDAVVKLLLDKGADLESKGDSGWTPLFLATLNGHDAVVKLLLDKGADLESKSDSGWTPLLLAAQYGHERVVKLFVDKGTGKF